MQIKVLVNGAEGRMGQETCRAIKAHPLLALVGVCNKKVTVICFSSNPLNTVTNARLLSSSPEQLASFRSYIIFSRRKWEKSSRLILSKPIIKI